MTSALIINADDLGLSQAVNRGIETAHRDGILTSATLLPNAPDFEEGVAVACRNHNLGVGIHLNIIRGRPVSSPDSIPSLVSRDGCFNRCRGLIAADVEAEYRAQIEKVLEAGIAPTHLDFEKHHGRPSLLYSTACHLANEYRIPAIRNLCEPVWWSFCHLPRAGFGALLRSVLLRVYITVQAYPRKPPRPDWFLGQLHIGAITEEVMLALLSNLPEGIAELMVHPGYTDEVESEKVSTGFGESWIDSSRPVELSALTAPAVKNAAEKCNLTTFGVFTERSAG